jgi:hypothetical protein
MVVIRRGRRQQTGTPGGGGEVPPLDGEVTSSAEIITVAENAANAGNSYWMRGGSYGNLTLDDGARPASTITFRTYPGEQVTFADLRFQGAANIALDGNEDNMVRSTAGGFSGGDYGLWIRGSGVTGFDIAPVPECLVMGGVGSDDVENITLQHFRLGDSTSSDETDWRCQHGVIFVAGVHNVLFEDFEISYIGADIADFDPVTGDGDANGGGFGLWWGFQNGNPDAGDFTFRRGHFHHTMNDFGQYGPNSPTALVLFEDCLFEEVTNFGDAHADVFQVFGGEQALTFEGCVFRNGTDFLFHGDVDGNTRLFSNCLIGDPGIGGANINNLTLSRDNESGPTATFEFRDCTMQNMSSLRCDSTLGASYTRANVLSNCIYPGVSSTTGINRNNFFAGGNDGLPNLLTDGGTGITGDVSGTPTYNSQGECTSHSQGWRKPGSFPWSL